MAHSLEKAGVGVFGDRYYDLAFHALFDGNRVEIAAVFFDLGDHFKTETSQHRLIDDDIHGGEIARPGRGHFQSNHFFSASP